MIGLALSQISAGVPTTPSILIVVVVVVVVVITHGYRA
jgi:hypothetical protein